MGNALWRISLNSSSKIQNQEYVQLGMVAFSRLPNENVPWLNLGATRLQEMDLGKSAYVLYDPTYEMEWTAAISSVLGDHYEKIASHQLIGIFLIIFANKALTPAISSVERSHLSTGHFSLLGNKGGVAVRLQCYDSTICFVDMHLYHAVEGMAKRTEDFRRIVKELVFENAEKIKAHDHVFLFGDLNYRVWPTSSRIGI